MPIDEFILFKYSLSEGTDYFLINSGAGPDNLMRDFIRGYQLRISQPEKASHRSFSRSKTSGYTKHNLILARFWASHKIYLMGYSLSFLAFSYNLIYSLAEASQEKLHCMAVLTKPSHCFLFSKACSAFFMVLTKGALS